ncbi:Na/Pi cotransporter family protein [Lacrimispora saccharolytica]|uniref:Na/Pi-cotransporter II-related protein n=1 Tax=Lacrimispora saccharolytica (strain ATCC 35040 / DSM 2544 / NRCC 2533 / WM1) TaxID=610130 RepID=D9R616_LACSW|nr:Na/Pi cotransporter family protein [Lacrimispora saccharolytica]ADL03450.1 Na/Pi-cotransporter II-related protein [[Clostridium] saccharolyticum WM1]QRV18400.1 Na/Pi cotransporter family protein [Lacrimispora saccharolytica]
MSINDISSLFGFMGGLGMFLYGMNTMADGMQKSAGSRMSRFLGMLTNNRFLAVILGALITAIIQSSGATTVMVVGFVSAGVLNLTQAVGVIMGANIGTTITAWIVSMNQLGDAFSILQPSFSAPLFIGIGAVLLLFGNKQRAKTIGEILVGLGMLFVGLDFMSGAISPYTDAPVFSEAFRLLGRNPLLGMLIGALVTALLQSSSASVGILQTLAMNGVVTTNAAIFITLGQNIGSCVTALISSIGGSRTAKRAAVIHLSFNVMGALIFGIGSIVLFMAAPALAAHNITAVQISIFHTFFNLTNTCLLFPFAKQLVHFSGFVIPESKTGDLETAGEEAVTMKHLDERIFESPAFAVETAAMEVVHMGQITLDNVKRAMDAVLTKNEEETREVYKTEKTINNMEKMLIEYLVKINNLSLTEEQKLVVNNLFYSVNDIERVGDHAENLAEQAEYMIRHEISFSDTGASDLKIICEAAYQSFFHSIEARRKGDMEEVRKVNQCEDEVDLLEEELREKHIERLSTGECNTSSGVVFLELISNLERISDHSYNLASYVKNEI